VSLGWHREGVAALVLSVMFRTYFKQFSSIIMPILMMPEKPPEHSIVKVSPPVLKLHTVAQLRKVRGR